MQPVFADRWELRKKKTSLFKKALSDSFSEMDEIVKLNEERFNPYLSGATLSATLITDENMVFTANVGDS